MNKELFSRQALRTIARVGLVKKGRWQRSHCGGRVPRHKASGVVENRRYNVFASVLVYAIPDDYLPDCYNRPSVTHDISQGIKNSCVRARG